MSNAESKPNHVDAIQDLVQNGPTDSDRFAEAYDNLHAELAEAGVLQPQGAFVFTTGPTTEANGAPAFRVTCPTKTTLGLKGPVEGVGARYVQFFVTRKGPGGGSETRMVGTAKYPDGDGKFATSFTTDRFSVSQNDPLVVFADLMSADFKLVASFSGTVIA